MKRKTVIIFLTCIIVLVSITATYSAFTIKITKTGSINTTQIGYCETNNILKFSECLIRNDSQKDLDSALTVIDTRTNNTDLKNLNSVEPINSYITTRREYNYSIDSNSNMATSSSATYSYVIENTSLYSNDSEPENISFNNTTGRYTYENSKTGTVKDIITTEDDINNGVYKYTCLNTTKDGNCNNLYIIYSYREYNNQYQYKSGVAYGSEVVGTSASSPGLYKTDDEYTTDSDEDGELDSNFTYFYRGDVNNNWVSFGGALWRVIRINGNGSIRMIYSGEENSSSHTGRNAVLATSTYAQKYKIDNQNITYRNGATYVGYMYNSRMTLTTSPNYKLKSEDSTSYRKVNDFVTFLNISAPAKYYFFDADSFNLNSNCNVDSGVCTMTCTNFDEDTGIGDNCIMSKWGDLVTNPDNFDETSVDSTTTGDKYINDNAKYTCWSNGTSDLTNGTVTVKCPVVSEILGNVKSGTTVNQGQAKVRYHGLFSDSYETATTNAEDSLVKQEIDKWYEDNILNNTDSNGNLLSDYLSDEVFCNDRSLRSGNGYNFDANATVSYFPYYRNISNKSPSLLCKEKNDRFTVSNTYGNTDLKYPIGLITVDEVALAGGMYSGMNYKYYLYIGYSYWTMSPTYFLSTYAITQAHAVNDSGAISSYVVSGTAGVRPVINLSSEVQLADGIGTEEDPYILKMN